MMPVTKLLASDADTFTTLTVLRKSNTTEFKIDVQVLKQIKTNGLSAHRLRSTQTVKHKMINAWSPKDS
jgi:hypothetical protein